jgi:hypothetical protein
MINATVPPGPAGPGEPLLYLRSKVLVCSVLIQPSCSYLLYLRSKELLLRWMELSAFR